MGRGRRRRFDPHPRRTDGQLIDQFNVGAAISGLAAPAIDGRGTLVVATDNGLDAWQVERR